MDSYVSCIKIRGTPILPPLLTDQCREEMNYYKQLAIKVEEDVSKRIQTYNENLVNINSNKIAQIFDHNNSPLGSSVVTDSSLPTNTVINRVNAAESVETVSDDEIVTKSTDINQYMNTSDSSKTDITEMRSECDKSKPAVPKTLDIIPITVETPKKRREESSEDSKVNGLVVETPKLVRQGSYVLDAPSPMLLAHLEQSNGDYIPSNGLKRREWNINQAKLDWTNRRVDLRRNSISISENVGKKPVENHSRMNGKSKIAKSVDCIHSMVTRETFVNAKPSDSKVNHHHVKKSKSVNENIKNLNGKQWNRNKNTPARDVAKKFGGSLETLSINSSSNIKQTRSDINHRMTKSFEGSYNSECNQNISSVTKPTLVSEKLIYVFKEIQKTHERQMASLMERQQKEQMIMQKEFEKQQMLLLDEIEKSFPGIVLPIENKKTELIQRQNNNSPNSISLPKSFERSDPETSPMNGSSFDSDYSPSLHLSTIEHFDSKNNSKKKNVNRQLFPNEVKHKTKYQNGAIYDDKRIRAVTTINAYARGYLVRRLMKTERLITLKNTYKEALHYMLKLHVEGPLELPEINFHQRLQHQCDAASISIVELFAQPPAIRMEIIAHDRQLKKSRHERPTSARSYYSFATQRTLARKKFKEYATIMGIVNDGKRSQSARSHSTTRSRCQTWTSNNTYNPRDKSTPVNSIQQGIKRSTSAGAVRKPWR